MAVNTDEASLARLLLTSCHTAWFLTGHGPVGEPCYRAYYPKAAEYTFFSSAHGTFSRIDHMLGGKTSFSKFKKIEIISSFLTTML